MSENQHARLDQQDQQETPTTDALPPEVAEAIAVADKGWSELTQRQRVGIAALGATQIALAVTAWVSLARRDAREVRGPKAAWALGIAVNWVGPVSYFTFGRRRD